MNVSSFKVGRAVLSPREHGAAGHRALLARGRAVRRAGGAARERED